MTIAARIRAAWLALPYAIRAFVRDAVEGSIIAVGLLNVVLPHDLAEAQAQAVVLATAIAAPVIASARRYLVPWLIGILRYLFPAP